MGNGEWDGRAEQYMSAAQVRPRRTGSCRPCCRRCHCPGACLAALAWGLQQPRLPRRCRPCWMEGRIPGCSTRRARPL